MTATSLAGLTIEQRARIVVDVGSVLLDGPFRNPRRWPAAVVVWQGDHRRVTSRGDLAMYLRANDLGSEARECITRRVPRKSILCWVELDAEDVSCAEFIVLDLAAEVDRLSAEARKMAG